MLIGISVQPCHWEDRGWDRPGKNGMEWLGTKASRRNFFGAEPDKGHKDDGLDQLRFMHYPVPSSY